MFPETDAPAPCLESAHRGEKQLSRSGHQKATHVGVDNRFPAKNMTHFKERNFMHNMSVNRKFVAQLL